MCIFQIGESPMVWRGLDLEPGRHTVTVRGSCIFNGGVGSTSSRTFRVQFRT